MRKLAVLGYLCVLSCAQLASAASASDATSTKKIDVDIPAIIIAGMDAYKDKGPDEAVKAWIKGSPIDGSKDALSEANILRQVQDFYGSYRAFEVISTRDLTPRARIIYLALDYDRGPLFAKFVVYRTAQGWILTSFLFNTSEDKVIPTIP